MEAHWSLLKDLGAGPAALMVVPRYHGRASLREHPEFLDWLRGKAAAGSGIFLHGYRHKMPEGLDGEPPDLGRSAWGRWVNRALVGNEAEFCGLPAAASARLLDLAVAEFREAGLRAEGFVAPTWHGSPHRSRLASAGLALWETRSWLHDLAGGRRRFAPALSWTLPTAVRPAALFGGRPWLELLLRAPLIKAVVHPGDLADAGVIRTLERVAAAGRASSYRDAFQA